MSDDSSATARMSSAVMLLVLMLRLLSTGRALRFKVTRATASSVGDCLFVCIKWRQHYATKRVKGWHRHDITAATQCYAWGQTDCRHRLLYFILQPVSVTWRIVQRHVACCADLMQQLQQCTKMHSNCTVLLRYSFKPFILQDSPY